VSSLCLPQSANYWYFFSFSMNFAAQVSRVNIREIELSIRGYGR
jgi:hypothetical protein